MQAEANNADYDNKLTQFLNELKESSLTSFLIIDLDALSQNYKILAQKAPKALIAPAVKADAYGLGALEVTECLYEAGARHFFVATLDEALELKKNFPDSQIYVLYGPQEGNIQVFKKNNLIPVLNSIAQIRLWVDETKKSRKTYPAFIHMDTGINRLGLTRNEFAYLCDHKLYNEFDLMGVMSHLACGDEEHHPLNSLQLERFNHVRDQLPGYTYSLANSGGIFLGHNYHFDMVRPGIALYGGNPIHGKDNPMKPVVSLYAKILQIKKIEAGETIGYGATFEAPQKMTIGILAYGYADGFLRSASNKGKVFYKGKMLPILGRISMDLMAIDLTSVVDSGPEIDDLVELLGQHISLDKQACFMGTIDYEVLTSLRDRAGRFYMK